MVKELTFLNDKRMSKLLSIRLCSYWLESLLGFLYDERVGFLK